TPRDQLQDRTSMARHDLSLVPTTLIARSTPMDNGDTPNIQSNAGIRLRSLGGDRSLTSAVTFSRHNCPAAHWQARLRGQEAMAAAYQLDRPSRKLTIGNWPVGPEPRWTDK